MMGIGWNALLWASIIWLPWLMYAILRNEAKPKKNLIVGVTLPYAAQRDPQVLALLETYGRELKRMTWLSMLPAIPCLFVKSFGLSMTLWLIWTIAMCFVPGIPYIRCNRALRQLKEVRGWKRQDDGRTVADLKVAAVEMKWLSPLLFVPPFLISLLPVFFDWEMWLVWLVMSVMVALFYFCYRFLYRNRAEIVDDNGERTLSLTRVRRYNWGKAWLIMAWATGLLNPLMWLLMDHIWWTMALLLDYMAVVVWAMLSIEFRVRRLQETLSEGSGQGYYVDEDDHWIWGMLYYNPNDARLIVNARVGINSTVNLAKRSGQLLAGLLLLLLLACPLAGVWMMGMERAPVELAVTETELVASHYGSRYAVALEDIRRVEQLEELPSIGRVAGTAAPNASTGTWSSAQWGRFTCCIDPRVGPWLLVETVDEELFLFNSTDGAAVDAVLEHIT